MQEQEREPTIEENIERVLNDDAALIDFLKEHFLALAVDSLFFEQERIVLKSSPVVMCRQIPQELVESLAADIEERMTLGMYFKFVVAHGFVPQLNFVTLEQARKDVKEKLLQALRGTAST